jgi:hypothetical protein
MASGSLKCLPASTMAAQIKTKGRIEKLQSEPEAIEKVIAGTEESCVLLLSGPAFWHVDKALQRGLCKSGLAVKDNKACHLKNMEGISNWLQGCGLCPGSLIFLQCFIKLMPNLSSPSSSPWSLFSKHLLAPSI